MLTNFPRRLMLTAWIYSHTEQWLDSTVLTVCLCGQHYDKPSLVRYPQNKPEKPGRLYRSTRSEAIWSDADEDAFATLAPVHIHLALLLALWTGRRQGDLLRLPRGNYDGSHIRLKQ